jgi:3-hydroxybutyryl-CoA dehydrogenase
MGSGIAQVCAAAGHSVVVVEPTDALLEAGRRRIGAFLDEGVRRNKLQPDERDAVLARVEATTDLEQCAGVNLVIEAVSEDLAIKVDLLGRVAPIVADALIATNTSALSVTEIAAFLPAPHRVAGLHFFNPAPLMPLVEVVEAVQTDPETTAALVAFARDLGKEPIVTKDRPGFLVNRLLMPYLNQAIADYDAGLASAEDIDVGLELGLGYPMGPLRLLDLIGLDTHRHATEAAYAQTRDVHYAPPPLLERLVQAGRLGRKTGRGIYEYEAKS